MDGTVETMRVWDLNGIKFRLVYGKKGKSPHRLEVETTMKSFHWTFDKDFKKNFIVNSLKDIIKAIEDADSQVE